MCRPSARTWPCAGICGWALRTPFHEQSDVLISIPAFFKHSMTRSASSSVSPNWRMPTPAPGPGTIPAYRNNAAWKRADRTFRYLSDCVHGPSGQISTLFLDLKLGLGITFILVNTNRELKGCSVGKMADACRQRCARSGPQRGDRAPARKAARLLQVGLLPSGALRHPGRCRGNCRRRCTMRMCWCSQRPSTTTASAASSRPCWTAPTRSSAPITHSPRRICWRRRRRTGARPSTARRKRCRDGRLLLPLHVCRTVFAGGVNGVGEIAGRPALEQARRMGMEMAGRSSSAATSCTQNHRQEESDMTTGQGCPKFAQLNDDVLFGEVWSRENGLSACEPQRGHRGSPDGAGADGFLVRYHLMSAKNNGVTRSEMAEILTHAAFYAGWPKAWAAFRMAKEVWADAMTLMQELSTKTSMVFPIGAPNDAFAQYFSGQSYLAPLSTEQVGIFNVTFEPGCRNNWHIHHANKRRRADPRLRGRAGFYQEWGKEPAQELRPGDVDKYYARCKALARCGAGQLVLPSRGGSSWRGGLQRVVGARGRRAIP